MLYSISSRNLPIIGAFLFWLSLFYKFILSKVIYKLLGLVCITELWAVLLIANGQVLDRTDVAELHLVCSLIMSLNVINIFARRFLIHMDNKVVWIFWKWTFLSLDFFTCPLASAEVNYVVRIYIMNWWKGLKSRFICSDLRLLVGSL